MVGGSVTGAGTTDFPWVRGVIAPLLAVLLMAAGPLVLLPYKRFNDVLDGATFGVASGVAFVGAQTFVTALNLFDSGLRPVGDIGPWIVRLLVLGVAMPVVAAGAIGGLCGVMWLRYRAPVADRGALGPLGHPAVAALIAAALMLVASLSVLLLPDLGHLIVVTLLAVLGLLWLRRIIHVGLLEEASEIAIGPAITCPECGKQTPLHTYCGNCGTSLKALPKSRGKACRGGRLGRPGGAARGAAHATRRRRDRSRGRGCCQRRHGSGDRCRATTAAPAPRHGWLSQRVLLTLFAVVMLGAVAIAAASAFITTQGQNKPDCPDKTLPCSGAAAIGVTTTTMSRTQDQAQAGLPFADRTKYHDDALGFGLEFDPTIWTISQQDAGFLILHGGQRRGRAHHRGRPGRPVRSAGHLRCPGGPAQGPAAGLHHRRRPGSGAAGHPDPGLSTRGRRSVRRHARHVAGTVHRLQRRVGRGHGRADHHGRDDARAGRDPRYRPVGRRLCRQQLHLAR